MSPDDAAAHTLFDLVNRERAKAGRPPLEWDDRLAQAAMPHAVLMAEKRMLSHQFSGEFSLPLRLAKTSLRLDRSGENVADDSNVEQAHIGLMNSPPHRANILSPDYNAIGIAVVRRGDMVYVVEDFAHRLPEITVAQVETQIATTFDRARESAGLRPLPKVQLTGLREVACSMAKNDEVDAKTVGLPQARHVVTFTMNDPQKLPPEVLHLRNNDDLGAFAVGVCFQRSPTYPSGVYWGVMAFFSKSQTLPHGH